MSYGKMMAMNHDREYSPDTTRRYNTGTGMMGMEQYRDGGNMTSMGGHTYDGEGMAFRDRTGRRHYDNGRYAPERNADDDRNPENMRIGFAWHGEDKGKRDSVRDSDTHMSRMGGQDHEMGRASVYKDAGGGLVLRGRFGGENGQEPRQLTKEMAEEWTGKMRNGDGSAGPHWSMEQVRQLQQQRKELQDFELPEVFAVMNMIYSACCKTAKKHGINTVDFYVDMSCAWLDDPNAGAGKAKTARYYTCIVK